MKKDKTESDYAISIAWDYFKLLAQQRITHFNLFIVFMGVITTVLLSNIGASTQGNIIALGLGTVQVFLCFIFRKIDLRNKYLTKHTEKIIKNVEETYRDTNLQVFIGEEKSTLDLRQSEKNTLYFKKQLSLSELYSLFYWFFLCLGGLEGILSVVLLILNF